MDTAKIIELAMASLVAAAKLIAELKSQAGMTDEQLLAMAEANGAETHATIQKLIAEAKSA